MPLPFEIYQLPKFPSAQKTNTFVDLRFVYFFSTLFSRFSWSALFFEWSFSILNFEGENSFKIVGLVGRMCR